MIWRRWVELWDRREPPTALAIVRIGVALVMLGDLVQIRRLGIIDTLWSPLPAGYASHYEPWIPLDAQGLWLAGAIAAAAMLIGAATRVACIALVAISAIMAHLAPSSESAIDQIFRIVLVILALSRCNARWSVDAWLARKLGRPPPAEVPAWPRYLLMLQLVWIYFSGGINKSGSEWGPFGGFTALADALTDPHVGRFDPSWLATAYPLARIATAVTMAFEIGAPLYLLSYYFAATRDRPGRVRARWNRLHVRWIWLALGISFELGIAISMRLGNFPWGMLALYPALLLPEELYRLNTPAPA
jgi:uncharacterized membrane protein YphA (DoxX/SURF4 family)